MECKAKLTCIVAVLLSYGCFADVPNLTDSGTSNTDTDTETSGTSEATETSMSSMSESAGTSSGNETGTGITQGSDDGSGSTGMVDSDTDSGGSSGNGSADTGGSTGIGTGSTGMVSASGSTGGTSGFASTGMASESSTGDGSTTGPGIPQWTECMQYPIGTSCNSICANSGMVCMNACTDAQSMIPNLGMVMFAESQCSGSKAFANCDNMVSSNYPFATCCCA